MSRLSIVVLLIAGVLCSPTVSKAGMYLGSFENLPAGQDKPDAAVIAAILAAVPDADLTGFTWLYKNDVDEDNLNHTESGIAADAFTVTYTDTHLDDPKFVGNIQLIAGIYEPLFYTVKIDGPNAGFNLYSWGGSVNEFTNEFYKDTQKTYSYIDDKGETQTNYWADEPGELTNYGVSHVSVWGTIDDGTGGPLPGVPEPSALAVWGLIGIVGLAWRIRRKVRA